MCQQLTHCFEHFTKILLPISFKESFKDHKVKIDLVQYIAQSLTIDKKTMVVEILYGVFQWILFVTHLSSRGQRNHPGNPVAADCPKLGESVPVHVEPPPRRRAAAGAMGFGAGSNACGHAPPVERPNESWRTRAAAQGRVVRRAAAPAAPLE